MIDGQFLHAVEAYLHQYGYWAVFGGILLEDFGIPLPGESLLIAGAVLAAHGDKSLTWVLLLAMAAAVVGDNIGYLIGRYGGRRLVLSFGRYVFLDEQRLTRLEGFFQRHGGKVVMVARFFQGLRQFNGIIAGLGRMRWSRFLLFNALGAALWVGAWGGAAYLLGRHAHVLAGGFWHLNKALLLALAAVLVLVAAGWLITRRRSSGPRAPSARYGGNRPR